MAVQYVFSISPITISCAEFKKHKQEYCLFNDSSHILYKKDGFIKIETKDSTYFFKDDLSNEYFYEYSIVGYKRNWILLLGQTYNTDEYFLINKKTNRIYTLVGFPQIYKNYLLCIEGDHTDGTKYIEIWKMRQNKIKQVIKFNLKQYDIILGDIYMYGNYIYIASDKIFLKIAIKSPKQSN